MRLNYHKNQVMKVSALSYAILLFLCSAFFSYFCRSPINHISGNINMIFFVPLTSVVVFGAIFGAIFSKYYANPFAGKGIFNSLCILFLVVICASILAGLIYPVFIHISYFAEGKNIKLSTFFIMPLISTILFFLSTLPVTLTAGIYITNKINKYYGHK